jgi:hypothetical protein
MNGTAGGFKRFLSEKLISICLSLGELKSNNFLSKEKSLQVLDTNYYGI